MTKEELKQEAEEKAKKRTKGFKCQDNCEKSYVMGALDFAEPREKRIAELEDKLAKKVTLESLKIVSAREKELEEKNRELRDRLCNVANNLLDSWCRNEEDYCPHLAKLEKENAEAKKQFTTAKELLNEFMRISKASDEDFEHDYSELIREAEQFLKGKING